MNLRATADPLDDLQRFINAAYAGYVAASQEPYAEKLAKRGFRPPSWKRCCAEIDVLATLDAAHEIADADDEETGDGVPTRRTATGRTWSSRSS